MKRFLKTFAMLACLALPALVACNKEQVEEFSFELQNAEGTQAFIFGETREFPFKAVNVSRSSFEKPEGWEARLDFSSKVLKITAPTAEGAESGVVVVKVYSDGGAEKTAQVNVAASEAAISFSIEGAADGVSLKYGESTELKATMSNVASVEASGVKGWKAEKVSDTAVKVTAPSKTDEGADLEGTLVLTPKTARGTAGTPVSIKASVRIAEPSVQFDKNETGRLNFGDKVTVKTTELTNVAKLEVKSAPKGWTASVKMNGTTSAEITITAPAQGSEFEGIGEVVLLATSDTESTCEAPINVSLFGINSAEDLLACAAEWKKGADGNLAPYTLGGELVLNADVDVSENKTAVIFAGPDFDRVFNGNGHTITYSLESKDSQMGLFNTVKGPDGTVKNLTIAGKFTITDANTCRMGGVTAWSDGGNFTNIVVKIDVTQTGESCEGYFGGITGDETNTNGGGKYTDCHFRGSINVQTLRFIGGIASDVWDNAGGFMTDCSNEGNLTVNTNGIRINSGYHGGITGKCDGSSMKFTRCFNTGNFEYDFGGVASDIEAIGGVAGKVSGTFEECYNTGNITFKNNNCKRGWAHVAGLCAWAQATKGDSFIVKKCYNKGNITAYGEDIATFVAYVRDFGEGKASITDSYSEGTLNCVFPVSTLYLGGFVSTVYNTLHFTNCQFTGKTMGYAQVTGASFVGRACDDVVIDNCSSTGNVYVGCHTEITDSDRPLVSGFVNAWYPKVTITNSTVKGNVFHMCPDDKCADKVMTSKKVLDGAASEETSTVDEATMTSAKDVTVTKVAKSDTWPADWK